MTVTAATKWKSNAEMIVDIVELGYIKPTDRVIDLTFGGGKWWTEYHHPGPFIACVETGDGMVSHLDGADVPWYAPGLRVVPDYRDLRAASNNCEEQFDVVVFDPPYVSMGGRATSGLPDFMDRYGLENAATTPELLQADNELGLREAMRITKPGGLILAKCAPYISSGVRKEGDWWARDAALAMGLTVHDMLIHVGDVRAQPKDGPCQKCEGSGRVNVVTAGVVVGIDPCSKCAGTGRIPRQVKHARNNYSVLFCFRRPPVRKRRTKVSG